MGVDYSPVGGIGIEMTDEILGVLQKQVDLYECKDSLLDELELSYSQAGSGNYTGAENTYYIMVDGDTLMEINKNAKVLSDKLKSFGIEIEAEDFDVIQDLHVW